ncbi:MAG: phosphomannomutase/phosphoglucomutase [Clostridiales bacterium]|nr:phosphomannomutase/phosphoglucomutase [Clostridiales bacterium]
MKYLDLQNGSDIRGVAISGKAEANITPASTADIAFGFVTWLSGVSGKKPDALHIAVGRDSRITGPALQQIMCEALSVLGARVSDAGLASTPAMFMSCIFPQTDCDGAIMISASHLPSDRNGFKFFEKQKGGLDKADITEILRTAARGFPEPCDKSFRGECRKSPLMDLYSAHLRSLISSGLKQSEEDKPLAGLKIAVDAGNGAGGFYATEVLAPLGADISASQFLEPDGTFPNHSPNPEDEAAMSSLCERVKESGADLGIIFDTDVDRMAVAGSDGRSIARNGIVALAALLASNRGIIVTDSITSTQLHEFLVGRGYEHLRYKRGYRNVINKAVELNEEGRFCPLAIETSGHAALKENYFLDDGAYLATKIVVKTAQLKREGRAIESLIEDLKEPAEAAEFRLPVLASDFASYADAVLEDLRLMIEKFEGEPASAIRMSLELPNYEGVRVNCEAEDFAGWFLIRKSLHDPLMPINIESDCEGGVARIATALAGMLSKFEGLDLSLLRD